MSLSKDQFEKEVDACLRKFADDLKTGEEYYSEGIQLCESVRNALEQATRDGEFTIASTHYGGSIGKKTDVHKPDFDIVMKVNDQLPPFKDILNFFELILKQNTEHLKIIYQSIRLTKYSIQFSFTNGMEVDLLPAVAQLTEEEVLREMKRSRKNRHYFSSSLVNKQVGFVKEQSAFAHAVARLAKHWYKKMEIVPYICGGSTIFEILAIAAVIEERNNDRESMYSAFMRVVTKLENLNQLQLAFETYGSQSWRVRHPIRGQKIPYLLEPANPTNNMLQGMKPHLKNVLKTKAYSMRLRLQKLMENRNYCQADTDGGWQVNFEKLFKRKYQRKRKRRRNLLKV